MSPDSIERLAGATAGLQRRVDVLLLVPHRVEDRQLLEGIAAGVVDSGHVSGQGSRLGVRVVGAYSSRGDRRRPASAPPSAPATSPSGPPATMSGSAASRAPGSSPRAGRSWSPSHGRRRSSRSPASGRRARRSASPRGGSARAPTRSRCVIRILPFVVIVASHCRGVQRAVVRGCRSPAPPDRRDGGGRPVAHRPGWRSPSSPSPVRSHSCRSRRSAAVPAPGDDR